MCLHSYACFFFKLVSGKWLAMARFLCVVVSGLLWQDFCVVVSGLLWQDFCVVVSGLLWQDFCVVVSGKIWQDFCVVVFCLKT